QWLMRGLSRHGRPDIACRLATNPSYPSWGHMAANGATTIWELWNGNTANPGMNSQNHVMLLGDLLIWYFEDLAGIKALEPAFKYIRMRPGLIDGLDEVKASHRCPYGEILSHWRKDAGYFRWDVAVPPNATAEVHVPTVTGKPVKEGGKPVAEVQGISVVKVEQDRTVLRVGSGRYLFEGSYQKEND